MQSLGCESLTVHSFQGKKRSAAAAAAEEVVSHAVTQSRSHTHNADLALPPAGRRQRERGREQGRRG